MILDLDAVTRNEISSMCYSRWCKAYDEMKAVKAFTWESQNKFCPKDEWPLYHASMLEIAERELKLAEKLKADICPFSPLIKGE